MSLSRYSVISEKNPREIVLLRGRGCFWKKCRFCDYHLDSCPDPVANCEVNAEALAQVTGKYGVLEVVNSGSFPELDASTLALLETTCYFRKIHTLHLEAHWHYRDRLDGFREQFKKAGITTIFKIGVETFDVAFRENVLNKNMGNVSPEEIAQYFQEACLLVGLAGQTLETMRQDIDIGLAHFKRVCINVMSPCTAPLVPDKAVIDIFMNSIYPKIITNPQIDILISNTDFGIG